MMPSILRATGIAALAILVGGVSATLRGLAWKPDRAVVEKKIEIRSATDKRHDEIRKTRGVSLDEFKQGMASGAIVIDARTREDFEKGHLKTPGDPPVLNVEPHNVEANLNRLMSVSDRPFLIYCNSEECKLGEELYVALEPYGFSNMRIYFAGWKGLEEAKMPAISGPDLWAVDVPVPTEPPTEDAPAGTGETP